ncbi:hypothetical protein C0Q70_17501 [Pomacea canaliculata]|uniref:Uncharacterized protein n=1 Tax=Pomacea canaliculata TaxID=400727 RepID=A0A2T7NKM0_POMCA|nr:hypothetical protein C0Q70_17501 [Pomacea canaliculata]
MKTAQSYGFCARGELGGVSLRGLSLLTNGPETSLLSSLLPSGGSRGRQEQEDQGPEEDCKGKNHLLHFCTSCLILGFTIDFMCGVAFLQEP